MEYKLCCVQTHTHTDTYAHCEFRVAQTGVGRRCRLALLKAAPSLPLPSTSAALAGWLAGSSRSVFFCQPRPEMFPGIFYAHAHTHSLSLERFSVEFGTVVLPRQRATTRNATESESMWFGCFTGGCCWYSLVVMVAHV